MKNTLLLVLFSWRVLAQTPVPIDERVGLSIASRIRFGGPSNGRPADVQMEMKNGIFHRILRNSSTQILFGYDLEVKPVSGLYHVITKPLDPVYARTLQKDPIPTLSATNDVVSSAGGTMLLELLFNPSTGQKLSDVIKLVDLTGMRTDAPSDGLLHMNDIEMWSYQTNLTSEKVSGGVTGPNMEVYLPNHGSFFFTLTQPKDYPQFQKVGTIDGKQLKFIWANRPYELISNEPILSNAGTAEVWVYYDPQYKPKQVEGVTFHLMSVARMSYWFGKNEEE